MHTKPDSLAPSASFAAFGWHKVCGVLHTFLRLNTVLYLSKNDVVAWFSQFSCGSQFVLAGIEKLFNCSVWIVREFL